MSTIIYPSPIFGPVKSRRLGISLGINLQPSDGKSCTFDCIYCECGLNKDHLPKRQRPSREEVKLALEAKLQQMTHDGICPDVLTFAGNGEPTAHPCFAQIIDDTLQLRNHYFPRAKVSVLSNSTFIHRKEVRDALMRVDNNILKLDTVDAEFIRRVDRPVSPHYDVRRIVELMKLFEGHVIVQTMFLKGAIAPCDDSADGATGKTSALERIDNTTDRYVLPWLEALREIRPEEVMIYTIDRETPVEGLLKATPEELNRIRDLVISAGIPCQASY